MASFRRILILLTIGALLGVVILWIHPVHSRLMKAAFLAACGFSWSALLFLSWKRKGFRVILLLFPLVCALPFLLPGRSFDSEDLRAGYVKRIQGYEGAAYYWGGENRFGIDCSGLPRRAFRDALFSYGIRNGNGKACRMFLEQWLFDSSARTLGEGYRGFTRPLSHSGKISEMDHEGLIPGDLAVTKSGAHILAYLGEGSWIQADPGAGRVIILHGKNDQNIWFDTVVTAHRWTVFVSE